VTFTGAGPALNFMADALRAHFMGRRVAQLKLGCLSSHAVTFTGAGPALNFMVDALRAHFMGRCSLLRLPQP
ncbi:MAG: hypothetical protein LBG22_01695, partial [Treponema sp.]|nr:hypothetical protein [Treponema sp.]